MICVVPWTQLEICNTGKFRPCAEWNRDLVDANGEKYNFNDSTTIEEVWNSADMQNLRAQFLRGEKPDLCSKCWKQESQGLSSTRTRNLEAFPHHVKNCISTVADSIVLLDLKLGIKCNLQCKICCSEFSSNWAKDELDMFGQIINQYHDKDYTDQNNNWQDIKSHAGDLEALYLSGGEPLLLENCIELLQDLVDNGIAQNIWLKIHTNGTIRITDKILDILKQYKKVRLMFSIDGIGKSFEYQRYPSKWAKVESNFVQLLEHDWLDLKISYTASILNCFDGTDVENWCNQIGFSMQNFEINFLRDPVYYDMSMLDENQKQYVVSKLNNGHIDTQIKKYIKTTHQDTIENADWKIKTREDLDNLRKYVILSLDQKKKQSLEQVSPLLAELVDGRYLGNK